MAVTTAEPRATGERDAAAPEGAGQRPGVRVHGRRHRCASRLFSWYPLVRGIMLSFQQVNFVTDP